MKHMKSAIRKITSVNPYLLLVLLVLLLSTTKVVFAEDNQSAWFDATNRGAALDAARGINQDGHAQQLNSEASIEHMMQNGILAAPIGWITGDMVTNDPDLENKIKGNSALSVTNNMIAGLYNNPVADSVYFAMNTLDKAGLASPAYAQGIGYSALAPLMSIWMVFRNLSFVLLIGIVLIMGIMIMFRKSLDPQTALTIQLAIPRIIVTVVLVYFSYAIVGLLIDFMYFAILLVISIFGEVKADGVPLVDSGALANMKQYFTTGGIARLFGLIWGSGWGAGGDISGGATGEIVWTSVLSGAAGAGIGAILFGGAGALVGVGAGALLIFLLYSILLLFVFVRIFFSLFMAYINVVIALIFGPIQILMGAFPGQSGFGGWFRGVVANLAVFPILSAFFMLAAIFNNAADQFGTLWTPPFVAVGDSGRAVMGLISLGVLLIAPKTADIAKEALHAEPSKYGAIPGAAIGSVFGIPFNIIGGAVQHGVQQAVYARAKLTLPTKNQEGK